MRTPDTVSRDRLPSLMARRGPASASSLAAELGVSVATLHRLLQERAGELVSAGLARRSRHALRRRLRGGASALPLASIDAQGRAHDAGQLVLVQPAGCWLPLQQFAGMPWPLPKPAQGALRDPLHDAVRDGWWPGLPYPLQDLRPQGYLGRQLARAGHAAWGVSPDPQRWSDDDALHVLSQAGSDGPGNLVVGEPAIARWQAQRLAQAEPLAPAALGPAYTALAEQAVAAGVAGSSAAGEFPKFPALRDRAGADTAHVLVKFSGAGGSAAEQRWADLLVCEHLALQTLNGHIDLPGQAGQPPVRAAHSTVVQHAGRTFLEVERFDRHGLWGRSPLVSLATLDGTFLGQGSGDWPRLADALVLQGLVDAAALPAITQLWWFGRLIANTDMHTGNLSFQALPRVAVGGTLAAGLLAPANALAPAQTLAPAQALTLAPAYDMLPMAYAPLPGGEVAPRAFMPAAPPPAQRAVWLAACSAAISFWRRAAADSRISEGFRATAAANAQALTALIDQV